MWLAYHLIRPHAPPTSKIPPSLTLTNQEAVPPEPPEQAVLVANRLQSFVGITTKGFKVEETLVPIPQAVPGSAVTPLPPPSPKSKFLSIVIHISLRLRMSVWPSGVNWRLSS